MKITVSYRWPEITMIITVGPAGGFQQIELEMTKRYLPEAFADKRLLTFTRWGWPHKKPSPKRLADAGFYREKDGGNHDRVRCFWCGVILHDWEQEDDPLDQHAEWSPKCPVFGKKAQGKDVVEV